MSSSLSDYENSCLKSGLVRWVAKAIHIVQYLRRCIKGFEALVYHTTPGYNQNSVTEYIGVRRGRKTSIFPLKIGTRKENFLENLKSAQARRGGEAPFQIFRPHWQNVLGIVENYWT